MASLTKKRSSAKWIACFTDAVGVQRQRSTGISDIGTPAERSLARRKAVEIATEYEAAARGDRTEAQIRKTLTELYNRVNPSRRLEWATTRQFLTEWLKSIQTRKTGGTHARYGTVVDRFLAGLAGRDTQHLGEISTADIQAFVDAGMKAGRRAGTIRLELKVLNAAFTYAHRQGLIVLNPVTAAELPDSAGETKRPFTTPQVRALVSACDPQKWSASDRALERLCDWKTAILLGAFAGLRLGDACNLRWSSIDLTAKTLTLKPEKTRRKSNQTIVIPIHASLEARLLEVATGDAGNPFVSPGLAGVKVGGRAGLSRQFQRIMAAADVANEVLSVAPKGGREINAFGFHSLRHYYVTALANADVAQDIRMALVGHASAEVNEIYTHRGLESLRAAILKLPAV